jgi:hypothetical protein
MDEIQVCGYCRRDRTIKDVYDYSPRQVMIGEPLGWYSDEAAGDEICPECMTRLMAGSL